MFIGDSLPQSDSSERVPGPKSKPASEDQAQATPRIVIPLDGSELSEQALGIGQTLATLLDGTVELVQVVDPTVTASASLQDRTRYAEDYLLEVADRLGSEISVKIRVLLGNPVEELLQRLSGATNTVVAMSTHGRGGLQRMLFGSVADKVIRSATVPVTVVRNGTSFSPSLRNLTVPLDGSDVAASALPMAMALARDDCTLGLVRVVDDSHIHENLALKYGSVWSDTELLSDISFDAEQTARASLADTAQRLRAAGCRATWEVRVGHPNDEIIRAAETTGTDLIVMATHGLGGVRRWAFGSVADEVIHGSNIPVLVIPPHTAWNDQHLPHSQEHSAY